MTEYVAGFMVCSGQVLLITKSKPEWQRGRINAIGGHIERGEIPVTAMIREFEEETGIKTRQGQWQHTVRLCGGTWTVYFFVCYAVEEVFKTFRSNGDEKVDAYQISNLPSGVLWNVRWLLPLSLDADLMFPIVAVDETENE